MWSASRHSRWRRAKFRSSHAKCVLFATGGAGRIFAAPTNAFINTGDGLGMAARRHPARRHGVLAVPPNWRTTPGVLLTEGRCGEGAILRNKDGERFMERYAPKLKDLAPRDFASRCMDQEIKKAAAAARTATTSRST